MKINKIIMLSFIIAITTNIMAAHAVTKQPPHGYIDYPPSRAFLCNAEGGNLNKNCGAIQYEPQSLEGVKGFPSAGPSDGHIASAGKSRFYELDEQTTTRWFKTNLKSGETQFNWHLTARHRTTSWQFFITQPDWNMNKPLTRSAFDLTPFCEQYDNGQIPLGNVKITCDIPERQGYHIILGVWTIADTGYAFYQVIDANIN
nr:lytic polysaccharide monooxygenase [uncultured Moellerella sp.]